MNINQTERDNLFKGLGLFLEPFRTFLVSVLRRKAGRNWVGEFENTLTPTQLENWKKGLRKGTPPEDLIDFHHFKNFAIKNKEWLRAHFGGKVNDIPSWLGEIAEVRHKVMHFDKEIDEDAATKAWIHMKAIARLLKMDDLEAGIVKLKENKVIPPPPAPGVTMPEGSSGEVIDKIRLDESEHLRHEKDKHVLNVNEFCYRHREGVYKLTTTMGTVIVRPGDGRTPEGRRAMMDRPEYRLAKVRAAEAEQDFPCLCREMKEREAARRD